MPIALVSKLERYTRLSDNEKLTLERTARSRIKRFAAHEDIIQEGDNPEHVNLILTGWACRYKHLEDGRRQIMAYFVPGDICDMRIYLLKQMDHSIGAISQVTIAAIVPDVMQALINNTSRISQALCWSELVAHATEREWIVSLGQRSAFERLAHLFCELFLRLQAVGLVDGNSCEWPITQAQLGETLGLSNVHVNRTLQEMRGENLIVLQGKILTIPDLALLQRAALFTPTYLHLNHEGQEFDAFDP